MSDIYKIAKSEKAVLEVIRDEDGRNPREEMDNLGTMICWHNRYSLGDDHSYSEPNDFLQGLCEELFGYEDVGYIQEKANKHMAKYTIVEGDIYEDSFDILEDGELFDDGYDTREDAKKELQNLREQYIDEIYGNMRNSELIDLIKQKAIMLPLYLYDHSGITMSTSDFCDRWDSGQVGWIYCTKERFMKETGYTENELFSDDSHRIPAVKEHVKIKGYEDKGYEGFGQVKSIENDIVTVDYDYNKIESAKKSENVITARIEDIIEVYSNRAKEMLIGEVETYDQYLTGDVYGYKLIEFDTNALMEYLKENEVELDELDIDELENFEETEDSCWGFYGDDAKKNGISDNIPAEYLYLIDKLEYAF